MIPKEVFESYEPTIGIECHVQLKTKTKLFSGADNDDRDKAPNRAVSPICFGLPGTLPVLNEAAVRLAVCAGFALNAKIGQFSSFDRKHYFYPDLPKGYQITQLDHPIVLAGHVNAPLGNGVVKVRIHHAHLEEDAGKSTHPAGADYSLVDLNRAGTPLLEIVSEADMHSAAEAKAYVQELYLLMKYAGVTFGDLSRGNMRFDVNISVAKKGAKQWGTRAEVKNLNSFRAVERAVEYETKRQVELLEKGGKVKQETRGWVEATQKTVSQRSKEDAMDYRYFPEPDVPPLELSDDYLSDVQKEMPLLPEALRQQIESKGVDQKTAETLLLRDALTGSVYTQTVLAQEPDAARFTANFIANRDVAYVDSLVKSSKDIGVLPGAEIFNAVYELRKTNAISSNNADALLFALRHESAEPKALAEKLGYLHDADSSALEATVATVIANPASQKAVDDVKAGQDKAIGYLVGQVMKASGGKANPAAVGDVIRKQLGV
ncbi:MAG TPA: Asp-tRNA(Asn)/Glu-tRNA(Gln) amidotransferase subunit GatB [Magnetospirillaceae bacterium]|nr:Asp-tRNA(Asn)/Glu-tRNA(Gln) amidotransferase subunit GatB [Magnetospirillaceae bacterium]